MSSFVIYNRVNKTPSLREQEATSRQFVQANQGRVVASFTEKGATRKGATRKGATRKGVTAPDWPVLRKAVDLALSKGATLVISCVGRLSRSAPFTSILLQSGVQFVCCDMPTCNHRTIHIVAATAEEELNRVRTRTREGLAAAKAAGVKLGSNREGHWKGREHKRGWKKAVARSIELRKARAAGAYAPILPEIKTRRERGDTLPEIVEWLNGNGHVTTAGKPFTQTAVWRIIDRYLGKELLGNNVRKFAKASA
jgi:DNA invertase Pin-like site-specific DNA recombinase